MASLISSCNIGSIVNDSVTTENDAGPSTVFCSADRAHADVHLTPAGFSVNTVRPNGPWTTYAHGGTISVQDIVLSGFSAGTVVPLTLHVAMSASMDQQYTPSPPSLALGNTNFNVQIIAATPAGGSGAIVDFGGSWSTQSGSTVTGSVEIPGLGVVALPSVAGNWGWTDIIEIPIDVASDNGIVLRVTSQAAAWSYPDYISSTILGLELVGITSTLSSSGMYSAQLEDGTEFLLLDPSTDFENPFASPASSPAAIYLVGTGVLFLVRRRKRAEKREKGQAQ
jgi:hypothetical protein